MGGRNSANIGVLVRRASPQANSFISRTEIGFPLDDLHWLFQGYTHSKICVSIIGMKSSCSPAGAVHNLHNPGRVPLGYNVRCSNNRAQHIS